MRWGLLFFALTSLAQSPSVIAIRDARIQPVSGPVIERGSVVIRNGLILDVGASVTPPADAWVIDGTGLTVYPGLIDGLSTVGIPEPPRDAPRMPGAAPQTPPARGPEDRPMTNSWMRAADLVRNNERRIESERGKGFTSVVTFPSGGIFTGQGAVINLAGERAGSMVVDSRVGQQITMARGGFNVFPGSLMGTIAYIRQVYLDAGHYAAAKETYAKNPAGMERPAYDRALEGVLESPRILLPAVSTVEIDRMIRFAKELKRPAILYGAHEAYGSAELLKKSGYPVLVNLNWPTPPRDRDPDEVDSIRTLELRENAPSSPAALAKVGVKFGFYSGGAENVHRAVREAILKGLGEDDALRAMTLSVAEIYGVADRLGSIDKGKIANLVVTKGSLFVEKPDIQFVLVDGERFEPPPPAAPAKPEATQ
jgi:imidazolonepropionase-like amidohydrolase